MVNTTRMDKFFEGNEPVYQYSDYAPHYPEKYHQADFRIAPGVRCMAIHNRLAKDYCNSERFVVASCEGGLVGLADISVPEHTVTVAVTDFFRDFIPGYCFTIHKMQGATIREPYNIYEWRSLSPTLRYVAISRGTAFEDVNLVPLKK